MAKGWRQVFSEVQRALPRDATPQERAAATKRAAQEYRKAQSPERGGNKPTRANPIKSGNVLSLGLAAAGAYYGYQWWKKKKAGEGKTGASITQGTKTEEATRSRTNI